jgi:uncharacterized protein (TIGR02145 family)
MKSQSRFLYIIFTTILLFFHSCDNGKDSVSSDAEDIVINENVVIPEDDPELAIDEVGDEQITISFTGDAPDIEEDDILVGTENGGYLRKVSSVTIDGNIMEVETVEAKLTDAIENGSLDTTLSLNFGGSNRSLYGLELVQKMDGVTVVENGINISGTELFDADFNGTNVEISIPTGTITFTPDLDIGFDISWGSLEEFHAIASGALDFDFDIRGEFSGSIADFNNDDDPVELASFSHTFVQFVGIVPIVEVVTLAFEAGYSVDIGYSGAVQAGFDSNVTIECGAIWEQGNWTGVWNPSYDFNWHPPEWNAEAHVEIRGYVRPTISVELYAMAGPYLDVEPYLRYDAGVNANPPTWHWGLYGGMESTLGFQIHVLDWDLANFSTELLNPPYEYEIITDSGSIIPNTPPTIESLTADPTEILVDQTSQLICAASDDDGHDLTYNWSATCGSISGSGNIVTFTAPDLSGDCTVSCNVNDGHGGTDNGAITFTINGPPGYVTLVSPVNGQGNLPSEMPFSWYAVSGAEHYDMQISTDPNFETHEYFNENITNTETIISNLFYDTLYFWRVRASNPYGDGPWTANLSSFTTGTPPAVPELVLPINSAVDQPLTLQLTWSSVDGAIGYVCEVSETIGFDVNHFAGSTENTSVEITGLSNATTYYWHLSAYDDFGVSEYSTIWQFTTESGGGGDDTCVDIDGNSYETVQIGNQLWMAENLKVTHYRNGDEIPNITDSSQWIVFSSGAYCNYNNDSSIADTYGRLYNWFAVGDSRDICPEGYHIPSDGEWMTLETALGMSESDANLGGNRGTNEGSKLAGNLNLWNSGELENNSEFGASGFNALPGGHRYNFVGIDGYIGRSSDFWSSTSFVDEYGTWATIRYIYHNNTMVGRFTGHLRDGNSVRCLGDSE